MSGQIINYPPPVPRMIEFKTLDEYHGYAVSYDFVRAYVWSCRARIWPGNGGCYSVIGDVWKELKQVPGSGGYLAVCVRNHAGQTSRVVHQLMMTAFHGSKPEKTMCCHGIAGKFCNLPSNLCYGTNSRNQLDRHRDGTAWIGEKNPNNTVSTASVRKAFELRQKGLSLREIGLQCGITKSYVSAILRGKAWKHLGLAVPFEGK